MYYLSPSLEPEDIPDPTCYACGEILLPEDKKLVCKTLKCHENTTETETEQPA